jgi:hypothetical protein
MTRRNVYRLIGYPLALVLAVIGLWFVSIRMPGVSHAGPLPALTAEQDTLSKRLRSHVEMLAGRIGERNAEKMKALDSAAAYMRASFAALGYEVSEQTYVIRGQVFRNIEVTLPGGSRAKEIVVVGGHYDSVIGTPGADDNASGAAAILELARLLKTEPHVRTIKLVAFTNEEPPFFFTEEMGSRHYARAAKQRGDSIVAMLSIETIGYYSDSVGSQRYPPILGWFYPNRGNFVGVVGNVASRKLVRRVIRDFREFAAFPSAGSAAPMQIPGISWSDQWSFWKEGYEAVMITDTAPFRNDNYHELSDRPETLNYGHMARVVEGVARTVAVLATTPQW